METKTKFCWWPTPVYKSNSTNKWLIYSRFIWLKRATFTHLPHFNERVALEKNNE